MQKDTARILESTGQVENALGFYMDAGDWGNAVRLVCTETPLLMAQGRGATISTWLSRLPQEVIDQTPWLLYWKGVLNLLTNQRESQSCFERAYNLFDVQRDGRCLSLLVRGSECAGAYPQAQIDSRSGIPPY